MYNIFSKQLKKIFLLVLSLSLFICLCSSTTTAAVIPGEGVPHYVENSDGQLVVTNENCVDTSPNNNVSATADVPTQNDSTSKKAGDKKLKEELPQEPNFTANIPSNEVKTEKKSKNFLIISLMILLGGAAVVFLVKRSKGE